MEFEIEVLCVARKLLKTLDVIEPCAPGYSGWFGGFAGPLMF
jgi:hypothetical protein